MMALGSLVAAAIIHTFDVTIIRNIAGSRGEDLVNVCKTLSQEGRYILLVIIAALLGLLASYLIRSFRAAIAVVVTASVAMLVNPLVKSVFERPRPDIAYAVYRVGGYSFPSGHSTSTMSIAVAVILILASSRSVSGRWLAAATVVLVSLAASVGFSRTCLGVHYPSDVLAGWALGTLCALIIVGVALRQRPRAVEAEPPA
ncbi:MAG: phosphatase PAP2 family protein [Thermoleophilia bacterium]|nr:phosphatase PAP2 family protein [Thermoleophilia bacterium]